MEAGRAKESFSEYLRRKELRQTRQREIILDAFLAGGRHITAEELYNKVREQNPEIGFATVHRNLKLMCDSGIAEEIKIGTQKARYEQACGKEHHDHLICVKCGKFIEVNDERLERLQDKLAEAQDFTPLRHKLEIYGFCRECR